mmetsp:Transcript_18551/g.40173  ORF Transcript_18551/g.40173 Transcript_18551/m.40173 type:complete len:125 (-) Transcript_18551:255-629(-)
MIVAMSFRFIRRNSVPDFASNSKTFIVLGMYDTVCAAAGARSFTGTTRSTGTTTANHRQGQYGKEAVEQSHQRTQKQEAGTFAGRLAMVVDRGRGGLDSCHLDGREIRFMLLLYSSHTSFFFLP